MTLAGNQPYFFPYLGYFSLIHATDKWVVGDPVHFIRKGWIHRNRILKPSLDDWQYILVPVKKHDQTTAIKDVLVSDHENWREKICAQLAHYQKVAPFYQETIGLVEDCFSCEIDHVSPLIVHFLKKTCDYLEIDFDYVYFSEMGFELSDFKAPSDWAINTTKYFDAKTYINLPGGRAIYDPADFNRHGIQLLFLEPDLHAYDQKNKEFLPGLSILDVLMFNSREKVQEMVRSYRLVP